MHSIWVPTDDDFQQYPHVLFTSADIWDASVLDHGITPACLEVHQETDDSQLKYSMFDELGIFTNEWYSTWFFWDSSPTETGEHTFHAHLHHTNPAEEDWNSLRLYFGWQSEQVIQNTYKVTSWIGGSVPHHDYLKNLSSAGILFSIFPGAMSLLLLMLSFMTSAINDGSTVAQFFVTKGTSVCDVYGIQKLETVHQHTL